MSHDTPWPFFFRKKNPRLVLKSFGVLPPGAPWPWCNSCSATFKFFHIGDCDCVIRALVAHDDSMGLLPASREIRKLRVSGTVTYVDNEVNSLAFIKS